MIKPMLPVLAAVAMQTGALAQTAPIYREVARVPLGAPDRWDYVVADSGDGRVYVAHGDRLTVVDASTLRIVGDVAGAKGGAHGTYVTAGGIGVTDDGEGGKALLFDSKSLKVEAVLDAAPDADAVAGDPHSGKVYVIDGDSGVITVIDPAPRKVVGVIKVGGSLEYGAADGRGALFVNGAERSEVVRVDTRSDQITARWPVSDCKSPHGMAIDPTRHRLFTSCVNNRLIVLDTDTGREVAAAPIGAGTDAAAYDPVRRRVFSSNGRDGTISVIQQVDADTYRPLATITTQVSGRTMGLDPKTGRIFVAAADVDPSGPTAGRRKTLPGTLKLLVLEPVP
jgi:YVTN family beta-propeller protein